jgi:hypothetical protein
MLGYKSTDISPFMFDVYEGAEGILFSLKHDRIVWHEQANLFTVKHYGHSY